MRKLLLSVMAIVCFAASLYAAAPVGWACFAGDGKVWRVKIGGQAEALTENVGAKHARWSVDGKLLFYIDGSSKVWAINNDGTNKREIGTGKVTGGSNIAAYRPDPNCVLITDTDGKFYKINAITKVKTLVHDPKSGGCYEIAISSDGTRMAARCGDQTWFNLTTGAAKAYNSFCSAGISPNGNWLHANNSGHQGFSLYSFNGSSASKVRTVGYHGAIGSGDNQAFAVNSNDWVIALHDNAGTNKGRAAGIANIDGTEAYKVADWSAVTSYPDFFLGNLPGGTTASIINKPGSISNPAFRISSNPHNAQVSIHIQNGFDGELTIYSVDGRAVWSCPVTGGTINWNKTGAHGSRVKSGLYTGVLSTGTQNISRRFVVF